MAQEPVGQGIGAELTSGAFGVKRVVFSVGMMSDTARRLLRKRLGSELDAVRDLIRKAEFVPGAEPAEPQALAPMEIGEKSSEAKRRRVSSSAQRTEEQKRTTAEERERLAGRLASLAAALPDRVVAFLQDQRAGDADYRGDGSETEMDMNSMNDGFLLQLRLLLDKFAPVSTPKNPGRAALDVSDVSGLSHHRPPDASGKTCPVEKEGNVGICDGASGRIQLRDIAEEYGELVGAIGVLLLSPLSHKLVDLTERDEYVDICGDASPIVFSAGKKAVETGGSPSSSSSGFGGSSSDSDSGSELDETEGSPPPPPPPLEKVQIAEAEEIQHKRAAPSPSVCPITSSPPAPSVLPMDSDISAQLPKSAPEEAVKIAKPKKFKNQCAAPAPTVRPIISSPPVSVSLPKGNGTSAQPPESMPEAAHGVEPEELPNQRITSTVSSITPNPLALAALPNENDTSAPPAPPALDAAHIAIVEPEEPQDLTAPAADEPLTDLIAKAQEAIERRKQEERNCAREKARQELLEMERAALPDERLHPLDMELLGIATSEHVVSTVEGAQPTRENGRAAPGCPAVVQFLGLFLKADDDSEEPEQWPGVAPGGTDMDVEEGEIR